MANPPSHSGQAPRPKRGRAERKRQFSNTMAVIRQDPHDVGARLAMVELLQEDERVEDSVDELMRVASVYMKRNVPIKAVAVLRQAVKLQPDRPEVRMAYGEVFARLRMVEDAAREYREAYRIYKELGNLSAMLDALSGVTRLDPGNLHANLQLGEALSRAGRSEQAAKVFRELADHLLDVGATEDWEKVAERAVFHDPQDVTLAHDLALHYVRAARYGAALSKLIVCYEHEPNDAELLELIVETLEYLGQRDRAASLTRRLVRRYRRAGLADEAQRALERLYGLDPDDDEAQAAIGALQPAVAPETVIELEHDTGLSLASVAPQDEDDEIGFGGDFIDELLDDEAPELPADAFDEMPGLPDEEPETEELPAADDDLLELPDFDDDATQMLDVVAAQAPAPAPTPAPARLSRNRLKATSPQRPSRRPIRNNARLTGTRKRFSTTGGQDQPDATELLVPVPERPAPRRAGRGGLPGASRSSRAAHPQESAGFHVDSAPQPVVAARPTPARAAPARATGARPAPAPRPALRRTSTSGPARPVRPAQPAPKPAPQPAPQPAPRPAPQPAGVRSPSSTSNPSLTELASRASDFDSEIDFGGGEATVVDPGLLDELRALDAQAQAPAPARSSALPRTGSPSPARTTLTAKRRSNSLPRPRLTRARYTSHDLPNQARSVTNDLKTLDFFIERGFYESAVALVAELDKRHPGSEELRARRQRIAEMKR